MNTITPKRKFNLLTTISMIVGIVIGSGIFFKTSEIIKLTNGNILAGMGAFLIAGFGIIFGSLTIANYAQIDEKAGGLVTYCELAFGKTLGFLAGWFQTVIYFPAICAIIAWVAANYTLSLFGQPNLLTTSEFNPWVWPIAIIYVLFFFVTNLIKTKGAGKFQEITTIIKLGALLLLAATGLFLGNPIAVVSSSATRNFEMSGFLSALIAVAFATDGWMLAPSVAHEIKNPKRNLPLALIIGPLVVIGFYLFYFFGVASSIGTEAILNGVDPISSIAISLFGSIGPKVVYLLVLISILGTLNGLVLTFIRTPYSLAVRNLLPKSKALSAIHPKYDTPINAGILSLILILIYLGFHFLSLDGASLYGFTLFKGLEVDALPIVANYFFLVCLYIGVLKDNKNFVSSSLFQTKIFPILALVGASFIIYGGITKPQFNVYLLLCFVIILFGLLIRPRKNV
ncbi:MAG: APC family permease [Anaerorhabdus sp.]